MPKYTAYFRLTEGFAHRLRFGYGELATAVAVFQPPTLTIFATAIGSYPEPLTIHMYIASIVNYVV
jgi:hypothetical protein